MTTSDKKRQDITDLDEGAQTLVSVLWCVANNNKERVAFCQKHGVKVDDTIIHHSAALPASLASCSIPCATAVSTMPSKFCEKLRPLVHGSLRWVFDGWGAPFVSPYPVSDRSRQAHLKAVGDVVVPQSRHGDDGACFFILISATANGTDESTQIAIKPSCGFDLSLCQVK